MKIKLNKAETRAIRKCRKHLRRSGIRMSKADVVRSAIWTMRAGVSGRLQVIDLEALHAYLDDDAEFTFLTSRINTLVTKSLEHAQKLKTRTWH